MLSLYTSKAIATSAKARSMLGYSPTVDFDAGMSLTAPYLQWAYADER
jgi:hypothetical protein